MKNKNRQFSASEAKTWVVLTLFGILAILLRFYLDFQVLGKSKIAVRSNTVFLMQDLENNGPCL